MLLSRHCLGAETRSSLPHVTRWFLTVVQQSLVKGVLEPVGLALGAGKEDWCEIAGVLVVLVNIVVLLFCFC